MLRYTVQILVLNTGKCPFEDWMKGVRDVKAKGIVRTRIDRVALGNFGHCRDLKGGLWELKVDFGPGYRVYFGKHRERLVLLLTGGDKSSQKQDIREARSHWEKFQSEVKP